MISRRLRDWFDRFIEDQDLDTDGVDEAEDDDPTSDDADADQEPAVDAVKLRGEIAELEQYVALTRNIREDKKSPDSPRVASRDTAGADTGTS